MNGGIVVGRDLEAVTGLVHQLDRVLFPPTLGDIMETLQVHKQINKEIF